MRSRTLRRTSLAALALFALNGCASLASQAFANPVVEVKDVRVTSIGFAGGSLELILDVYNPNEYRLDASKITYTFWVDTTQIATGVIERLLTVEGKGRGSITVPVTVGFSEASYALRTYARFGSLDYRVTGQFTLAMPFGNLTRPYSGTGKISGLP
jgi:LEA14-like dessication related protein